MKSIGSFQTLPQKTPIILFHDEALQKARHLVKIVPTECQWFHRVLRRETDKTIVYEIFDIYIPEQEVGMASVESGPNVFLKLSNEVKQKCGGYGPEYNEVIAGLTCWVHSHVNMGPGPSGTDNQQFKDQVQNGYDSKQDVPQIMLIFNKRDEYFSRIWDNKTSLMYENVPIEVTQQQYDMSYVTEAAKDKLTEKKYAHQIPDKPNWMTPRGGGTGSKADYIDWHRWGANEYADADDIPWKNWNKNAEGYNTATVKPENDKKKEESAQGQDQPCQSFRSHAIQTDALYSARQETTALVATSPRGELGDPVARYEHEIRELMILIEAHIKNEHYVNRLMNTLNRILDWDDFIILESLLDEDANKRLQLPYLYLTPLRPDDAIALNAWTAIETWLSEGWMDDETLLAALDCTLQIARCNSPEEIMDMVELWNLECEPDLRALEQKQATDEAQLIPGED